MQGNSRIYSPWYIKEIRFNRKLKPNISFEAYEPPVASQAFQTRGGGHFIRWKIVGGHAKKQATKKRYHFITLGVQHSVHLFIHA